MATSPLPILSQTHQASDFPRIFTAIFWHLLKFLSIANHSGLFTLPALIPFHEATPSVEI
ncbi:hypothetical protein F4555_000351 [Mobiluncus mulieris]|uniref:Uncharacterized protein n=1 Tax=Mobiluncus mulieris TaxID=2052 RepID=A0A8G2HR30_9ACTO|nr:hypothetical protein [Mobiluncus mulieris]SPX70961.1 Uncharacterised protein [Mobiluncus mulieris]STO15776.1 Uncharacterised protein [Mobiluncus mulieris]